MGVGGSVVLVGLSLLCLQPVFGQVERQSEGFPWVRPGVSSIESGHDPGSRPARAIEAYGDAFQCRGDLDGSRVVDVLDLLELISKWGGCMDVSCYLADINHNGTVDVIDMLLLISLWGDCEE